MFIFEIIFILQFRNTQLQIHLPMFMYLKFNTKLSNLLLFGRQFLKLEMQRTENNNNNDFHQFIQKKKTKKRKEQKPTKHYSYRSPMI